MVAGCQQAAVGFKGDAKVDMHFGHEALIPGQPHLLPRKIHTLQFKFEHGFEKGFGNGGERSMPRMNSGLADPGSMEERSLEDYCRA